LVWRNRKKISQIINAYLYLPFFRIIILWIQVTQKNLGQQLKGLSIAARLENIERRQEEVSTRNQQVVE
jgi:hypothetical protein